MIYNIYENWKIQKWETPVSNFGSSRLELLIDSEFLTIILQEGAGVLRSRVKFIFKGDYAYRNINESFRNDLWATIPPNLGQTLIVEDSDFLKALKADDLGEEVFANAKHYVLKTEDDVIEVVSVDHPEIQIVENADPKASLPGKSKIVHK